MSSPREATLRWYGDKALPGVPPHAPADDARNARLDFLKANRPLDVRCDGLSAIERDPHRVWRWGLGPRTTLTFALRGEQDIVLNVSFTSPFSGQSIVVKHNHVIVAELTRAGVGHDVALRGVEQNTLTLEYTRWDTPPKLFPNDARPVAAAYSSLALASADGGPLAFPVGESVSFPYLGSPIENEELARREYAQGRTVLRSLPPVVTLALTTHCNFQVPCLICDINTRPASADSSLEEQTLERARPLIATARYLLLHCGGESMMSKYFDKVVEMTSPSTTIMFATNAMLLTAKRAERLLSKQAVNFVVSLDAATSDTYRIMRPSGDFDTVVRNIKYFTGRMKSLELEDKARVRINMSICATNLEDVPAFVDLANELGVHRVEYNHLNPGLTHVVERPDGTEWDYVKEREWPDPARHDELLLEAWKRATNTGMPMTFAGTPFIGPNADRLDDTARAMAIIPFLVDGDEEWHSERHARLDPSLPPCFKPWQETVIQPTGNVRVCYYHDEVQYTVGNIVEHDFLRLWNSEEMVAARTWFLQDGVAPRCVASNPCQRCRH